LKRVFQVERPNEDTWILTRLAPPKITRAKITSRKVDGFTVFSCGRTVQQAEIRKLLDVFP